MAIWEALYDNDHNLSTGSFTIVTTDAAYTGAAQALAIASQANDYLNKLFSAGPNGQYYTSTAVWLDSTTVAGRGQDQITTPEPSSLMLLGLGGFFLRRRKRTAA